VDRDGAFISRRGAGEGWFTFPPPNPKRYLTLFHTISPISRRGIALYFFGHFGYSEISSGKF
jgi:hypothetical protein